MNNVGLWKNYIAFLNTYRNIRRWTIFNYGLIKFIIVIRHNAYLFKSKNTSIRADTWRRNNLTSHFLSFRYTDILSKPHYIANNIIAKAISLDTRTGISQIV